MVIIVVVVVVVKPEDKEGKNIYGINQKMREKRGEEAQEYSKQL